MEVAQPSGAAPTRLLVSLGSGDLRLVALTPPAGPATAATSAPLHPLRPPPPLLGARPFQLLAAYGGGEEADTLRCLVWAVRERAGERRASAEVYSLRLAVAGSGSGADLTLLDAELLLVRGRTPLLEGLHGLLRSPNLNLTPPASLPVVPADLPPAAAWGGRECGDGRRAAGC